MTDDLTVEFAITQTADDRHHIKIGPFLTNEEAENFAASLNNMCKLFDLCADDIASGILDRVRGDSSIN